MLGWLGKLHGGPYRVEYILSKYTGVIKDMYKETNEMQE